MKKLFDRASWLCFAEGDTPVAGGAPVAAPAAADPTPAPAEAAVPTTAEVLYPADPAAAPAEPAADPAADPAPVADPAGDPVPLTAESYAALTLPEGFTADDPGLTSARELFLANKVSVESAQQFLDLYAAQTKAGIEAGITAAQAQFAEMQTAWVNEVNALPEFQGEAKKQTLSSLGRMFDEYGSPEARQAFDLTGAGNNPAIVKMILGMAKALTEGAPTPGGSPAPGAKTAQTRGDKLYGTQQ